MKKSKDKIDEKILKDIESKLSLKKGLKEEDLLEDIDKIYNKLEEIQNDLATRPTRQEIYGWIIAGISIATLITVLM